MKPFSSERTWDSATSFALRPWLKDPSRVKDPGSRAARESMTLDDWHWNADQFNRIGEKVNAAGMRFAYHNHTPEFRSENGVMFYDELLRQTDPAKVTMEMDCGWAAVAGQNPAELSDSQSHALFHASRKGFQADACVHSRRTSAIDRDGPRNNRLSSHLRSSEEGQHQARLRGARRVRYATRCKR